MTMSHPGDISCRWQRTISRRRRRMRLRTTAPPNAFLMLNPKRQFGCPLARTKTVKWELERRLPARYTSSNSLFRTSRASRGNVRPATGPVPLLGREPMTALLAARRQHLAAAFSFHAHAKAVCFGAAAFPGLICTLWQSIPPCLYETCRELVSRFSRNQFELQARKTSSLQREGGPFTAVAAGSLHLPRWLWGLSWSSRTACVRAAFGII